ncbi:MAG: cardiolipin synthase [Metamycoplasmataceae bacterium]
MKKTLRWIIEILLLLSILSMTSLYFFVGQVGITEFILTIIIFYVVNIIISVWIFSEERNYETKLSWLIFIIIVPILGHIVFLFIGRKNIRQESKLEYEKSYKSFANKNLKINNHKDKLSSLELKMSSLIKREWKNSSFEIYKHGFEAYESLFQDIENAKHHIHIEMYIMKQSETYDQFKTILIKKSNEGIKVRILIDDFGKWAFNDNELDEMKEAGISIVIFNKIRFPFLNIKQTFRLHRKAVIIDGNIVHTGGINISDEYSSYNKNFGYWVDINARVTGDLCNDFSQLFLYSWFQITNERLSSETYITKQKNENINSKSLFLEEGPNVSEYFLEKSLMHSISFSSKRIRLATPYFIPSKKILEQLQFALLEGVEVEIFIPGKADKKSILDASLYYLNDLILNGAKVYEMNNMFLHSKIGTFDNTLGYLGTINLDMRSLYSNYESLSYVTGESVSDLDAIFDDYKKYANLVIPKLKKDRSILYLLNIFVVRLLSPLM